MRFRKSNNIDFKGAVYLNIKSWDKFSAIDELAKNAQIFAKLENIEEFINAVFQREQEKTTGFGHGVAVAHGKIASVKRVSLALGISKNGIDYNSTDGKPVHLLFLVATPPDQSQTYLKVLSSLMSVIRNEELRNRIINSENEDEIESILQELFNACYGCNK